MLTTSPTPHKTHPATASNHTLSTRHAREVLSSLDNTLAQRPHRGGLWAGRVSRLVGSPGGPSDWPLVGGGVRG